MSRSIVRSSVGKKPIVAIAEADTAGGNANALLILAGVRIDALRAQREKLRAALWPLAALATHYADVDVNDSGPCFIAIDGGVKLTGAHCHAARRALDETAVEP